MVYQRSSADDLGCTALVVGDLFSLLDRLLQLIMLLKRIPTVDFDPCKKSHRAAVAAYMRRKAWGDSPMRFTHDPAFGSVADQVQTRLLEWYVVRESSGTKQPKFTQLQLDLRCC